MESSAMPERTECRISNDQPDQEWTSASGKKAIIGYSYRIRK